jgi:hypothetical protein
MPTLRQLQAALLRADQQGDEEAVRVLAQAMSKFIEPPAPPVQAPVQEGVPTAPFSLKDTAVAAGQGVVGVGKSIADVFGADNAVSQSLGKTQEELSGMYSPARQKELAYYQDQMEKAKAEGPLAEAKVALQGVKAAPIQSAAQAVGSIIPNLATLLIPGVGVARAGIAARAAANTAIGVLEGTGAVKGSIYDNVYAALKKSGMSDEEAAQTATQAQSYMGENLGSIAAGGGLGYVAGRTGLESMLAPTAGKAVRKLGAVGSEFLTEGAQGGQEQLAANLALQKQGFDVPTMEGVAGAATQEGLLGAIGAGAVSPFTGSPVQPQGGTPPATPPAQQAATPPAAPTAPAAPQDAAQAIQAVQEQIAATTTEPTVRTDVAPPSTPAAPRSTLELIDEYKALNQEVDALQTARQKALKDGDLETLKTLLPEFEQKKNTLEELRTNITKQGAAGVENKDQLIALQEKQVAAFDNNLKAGNARLEKAIEDGDTAAEKRIIAKLEALKQKRQAVVDGLEKIKPAPAVSAEPAPPKEVIATPEVTAVTPPVKKEKRVVKKAQPEAAVPAQTEAAPVKQKRVSKNPQGSLFPASQLPVPKAKPAPVFVEETKETRVDTTGDLFSDFNLIKTASESGDQAMLSRLHRENEDAARRKDRKSGYLGKPSENIKTEETFKDAIKGIKRYEKVQGTYEYTDHDGNKREVYLSEQLADQIAAQRKKMEEGHTDKKGVYKRSMMERLHDLSVERILKEQELAKLKADKADAKDIAKAKVKLDKAKEHLAKQLAVVKPHMDKLKALQQSVYKTSMPKTEAEKQAEVTALGKSNRTLSAEALKARRGAEGEVAISEDRVAEEVGVELPVVKKFYKQQTKAVVDAFQAYNATVKKNNAKIVRAKKQFGEVSEEAKKIESTIIKETQEAFNAVKQLEKDTAARVKAFAIEKGKAAPGYELALQEAQADYTAVAREQSKFGEQTVKSLRTKQVTREVNKLKKFPTGSTESREQSAKRQAAFEEDMLDEETGNTREYERKQELLEMGKRAGKKPSSAMAAAMTKAGADYIEAQAREKGDYARGVEGESAALSDTQVGHLENNDIQSALRDIANDRNTTDVNRAVAQALSTVLDNTNVSIESGLTDTEGNPVLGEAISTMVKLNRDGGLSQEVLLHEGTHAGVERVIQLAEKNPDALTEQQRVAYNELKALWDSVRNDPEITSANAKGSISEFAAEVMSNEVLQDQLRDKPWTLADAWKNFKSIVLRLLGVKNVNNMLDASIQSVDALFIPSSAQPGMEEAPSYSVTSMVDRRQAQLEAEEDAQDDADEAEMEALSEQDFKEDKSKLIQKYDRKIKSLWPITRRIKQGLRDTLFPNSLEVAHLRRLTDDLRSYMDTYNKYLQQDRIYIENVDRSFHDLERTLEETTKLADEIFSFDNSKEGLKLKKQNARAEARYQARQAAKEETPRYAKVGVVEKAKGVFGFNPQTQAASIAPSFVASPASTKASLMGNFLGLEGRVQFVDKDAALSEAFKKGMSEAKISDLEAQNAEYFLRFGQNRSQYAAQFISNGPVQLVENKIGDNVERIYKSTPGANLIQMADAIAPSKIGNDTEKEAMLTALVAGERAKALGWDTLNISNPQQARKEYDEVVARLDKSPEDKAMFNKAMDIYRDYNAGLLDLLVQTGAMSKDEAARLKSIPYIPFYRVDNNVVELIVSGEKPVRIGNLRDQPELKQLVGDSNQIQPIFTSAVQNTFMITNMALRNQSVKETAFTLYKIGIASRIGEGMGPDGPDTVRFMKGGEQYHVVIDTDLYGIPADLIVKGMEGIKTSIPAIVRLLGMPANVLRQFVTRNPAYAVKQAIRDPLTAWMTTGTDGVPVLNAFKELSSMLAGRSEVERTLMASGAISSNVITGDDQDMQRALRDITSGKAGWAKVMAKLDAIAMQGDAATRAVVYKDSLSKGMTEQQALLRTLESMNFGRRGLSSSIQVLSTIIPFFNAQIQGLDVLYRAFKGDMPYSQKLDIQRKLMARGILLTIGTIAYAIAMGDDERYKRAKPEERLANWFVPNPFSKELMRIPVPFELGYLFKSLPEAVYNMGADDKRNEDITKGMGKLLALSNPFSLPQAVKPLTEVYLGKSFFGGDIESQREQKTLLPGERYRDSTTEVAKLIGSVTGDAGLTAIKLDHLVRGYTGPLGIALVSMVNPILRTGPEKERPTTKTSQLPFVGGLFQPDEGRGTLDAAFATMLEIQQAKGTYKEMRATGNNEGAERILETLQGDLVSGSLSGRVQQRLGEFATMRRNVLKSQMSQEQKDELLERLDTAQDTYANKFLTVVERNRRQLNQP